LTFLTSPDAQPNSAIDRVALLADLCGEIRPTTDPFPCELTDSGANPILYEQSIVSGDTTVFLSELALPPDPKFKDFVLPKESQAAINLLKAGQKSLDAMRTDLEGYAARLSDLQRNPADLPTTPLTITDTFGSASFLARTETRKLNILNLISNSRLAVADPAKKNLLVSITVVYGRTYVEGSYGVAFALRPIRTFTIAPTVGSGGVVSSYSIGETKAGPEVVPFVTASVAPFHDFAYPWSRWRGAIYASGGIGYNTSQESADLFVGPSLSWRGLLFSAFCDFGHASRLSQGLTNGESLGATTSLTTLPTENYWAPALAFAVSVRIPGITGR
jgi:hypothetical protein